MAASADFEQIFSDTPPYYEDSSEKEEINTPTPITGGQWQHYLSEKVPIRYKLKWRGKFFIFSLSSLVGLIYFLGSVANNLVII